MDKEKPYEREERRAAVRCEKRVGMYCSLLNDRQDELVTLHNFSLYGMYFASERAFPPGSWVVLRSALRHETASAGTAPAPPQYTVAEGDPAACISFRSHTVARVQRCEPIEAGDDGPYYGIGARIQWLTD